jgi:hypothetical protein
MSTMNTGRLKTMTDDHGDQFPGAVPAPAVPDTAHRAAAGDRIVRMHADYLRKANAAVEAGRDDLVQELAESFAQESTGASAGARRAAGRRSPTRGQDGRRPGGDNRLGRITRRSLSRFDRYTLDVFNPGAPYGRSDR